MEKWFIRNNGIDYEKMSKDLNISLFLSKILANRNITDYSVIKSYLNPSLDKLYNPIDMKDLINGVFLIRDNIIKKKKIRIVGDYDVDGVMSIYILYTTIKDLGGIVDYVIPDRVEDGYGINDSIVRDAKEDKVDTIITCDNGISAIDAVDLAKSLGINVIVTDHHDLPFEEIDRERQDILVNADVVINPKRKDCNYPFKLLCGAAIAFKLSQQLYLEFNNKITDTYYLLEFAAIATICDVVDLVDENRIIVKKGLELLNRTENIGLRSLMKETGLEGKEIGVYHIGFVIGPSINASGRLDSATKALELLLTQDKLRAKELSLELKELNDERKEMTNKGVENIIKTIEGTDLYKDKVFLIYDPSIHESIAGIIAGRIKDKYNKPTIVLTDSKEIVKGSSRSIDEYDMFEELTMCKDLLIRFGGHPMAAGLSLKKDNISLLRNRLNKNTKLSEEDLVPKRYIDMPLSISNISFDLISALKTLEPFGKGNAKPLFGEKNLSIERIFILGSNNNAVKLILKNNKNITIEGLIFGDAYEFQEEIERNFGFDELNRALNGLTNNMYIDLIYYPSINEYMGRKTLQIIIQSYRF